jgi:hypothetical protein
MPTRDGQADIDADVGDAPIPPTSSSRRGDRAIQERDRNDDTTEDQEVQRDMAG